MLFYYFPKLPYVSGLMGKCWTNNSVYRSSSVMGTKSLKNGKLLDKSVPYTWKELWPCPLDWRTTTHCNIGPAFFHSPWYIWPKQHFNVWLLSNQGNKFLVLVEILWRQDHRVEQKQWNVEIYFKFNNACILCG